MRILVCGGRDYADKKKVYYTLDNLTGCYKNRPYVLPKKDTVIIHGAASGADILADSWAVTNWVKFEEYPANWGRYHKRAGYIRNKRMLEEGKPDIVVAFPGGKGTSNMVKLAQDAGIPVVDLRQ